MPICRYEYTVHSNVKLALAYYDDINFKTENTNGKPWFNSFCYHVLSVKVKVPEFLGSLGRFPAVVLRPQTTDRSDLRKEAFASLNTSGDPVYLGRKDAVGQPVRFTTARSRGKCKPELSSLLLPRVPSRPPAHGEVLPVVRVCFVSSVISP